MQLALQPGGRGQQRLQPRQLPSAHQVVPHVLRAHNIALQSLLHAAASSDIVILFAPKKVAGHCMHKLDPTSRAALNISHAARANKLVVVAYVLILISAALNNCAEAAAHLHDVAVVGHGLQAGLP